MEQSVIISIRSRHAYPGAEPEDIEETVRGTLRAVGPAVWELAYGEDPGGGLAGTRTTLRVEEGSVTLTRKGGVETRMVFVPGERRRAQYSTMYGTFPMELETRTLRAGLTPEGGKICIDYAMALGEGAPGRHRLSIRARGVSVTCARCTRDEYDGRGPGAGGRPHPEGL